MPFNYWMLVGVTIFLGLAASMYVKNRLHHYEDIPISTNLTGAECARKMLAYYDIRDVEIHRGEEGQDFFDPQSNSVTLSPSVYDSRSITATATACHECGHAYQYAQRYKPMQLRSAIVPVVNIASNGWIFVFLAGVALNIAGFVQAAIALYAIVVLFSLVTLPVEFDASRRAMVYMNSTFLPEDERKGSFDVLRACALTYVAAALSSVLQLAWLLTQNRDAE